MKILIVPLTGGVGLGPLTHCLAVAYEARKRGHKVAFLCRKSFADVIKPFNYLTFIAPSSKPNGIKPPPFKLSDVAVELGLIDDDYIKASINAERKAIKSFKPDIIFTETQLTIPLSSGIEKIPFAASTSWADHPNFQSPLFSNIESVREYEDVYNKILGKYNLPTINDVCELGFLRADIKIAPTIPELQPELKNVKDVKYVGSLLSPEMEEGELPNEINKWNKEKPIIYVYMSPGDIPPNDWIKTVGDTFKHSEFNLMITLSPLHIDPKTLPHISNIKFYKQLPGSTASRKADLIITHGGSNTVANALLAGKPMMIFSHYYAERDYNGRAVEKYGAGINFRTEHFNPKDLLYYARKLIADKKYTLNAGKLGKLIKQYGGSKKAVDLLEEYIS